MPVSGSQIVDLVVLTSQPGPLHPEVEHGLLAQPGVEVRIHTVVGAARAADSCRYETIARARNEGKQRGSARWLMYVDDDVVLEPGCVSQLLDELRRRPIYAGLGADYLGEHRDGRVSAHVSMGATIFRRSALDEVRFRWTDGRCECQCCCDDLRRCRWGIDYFPAAKARHLPRGTARPHVEAKDQAVCARDPIRAAEPLQCDAMCDGPSVCLVLCYFGPIPGWISQYLLSCAFNPSIDFLIITDQARFPAVPSNVRVRQMSRAEFCQLAQEKIEISVDLANPRKLCDFKPAYGHLFEELLVGWDYWGYTDLDVIYGDLRRFLTDVQLEKFDVFTARKEFLVGHFTLFRNDDGMRVLYQESADMRTTLQSAHVLSFDECGMQWRQRMQGKPLDSAATCDSMSHVIHRLMESGKVSACFAPGVIEWPELRAASWRIRWKSGRIWVFNQQREAMYFHFHGFKQNHGFRHPCKLEGNVFDVSPQGFEPALSI